MSRRELDIETVDWKFMHAFGNFYKCIYKPGAIAMTGSAVQTRLDIPFPFRLIRIALYHIVTATKAASTDALTISFHRPVGSINTHPAMKDVVWSLDSCRKSNPEKVFGEGWEFEDGRWELELTSANTNSVHVLIYVQKLGGER